MLDNHIFKEIFQNAEIVANTLGGSKMLFEILRRRKPWTSTSSELLQRKLSLKNASDTGFISKFADVFVSHVSYHLKIIAFNQL